MKIIDRYVGQQVLVTTLFAVAVLSVVLVLGNVFKDLLNLLVNRDIPVEFIVSFIGYILPFSLTFTIPWGFLTAVLLVFGRLSAESELIALRASGLSVLRVAYPVFALAAVAVGICLWINVEVAPRAQAKMKNALFEIATSNPLAMFSSDKVIEEFPNKKIYVEKNEGAQLYNLLVYELSKEEGMEYIPMRVIFAKRGELRTDLESQQVLLRLYDARYELRDDQAPNDVLKIHQGIKAEEAVFPISLKELFEKSKRRAALSGMTLEQLQSDQKVAGTSGAKTEVSKRFSTALAGLAFALIGVPLAITAQRRETSIGFALSLLIAFVYFFFIIIADTLRNNDKWHPEYLVWTPNVVFVGLGLWLFWRLGRR